MFILLILLSGPDFMDKERNHEDENESVSYKYSSRETCGKMALLGLVHALLSLLLLQGGMTSAHVSFA